MLSSNLWNVLKPLITFYNRLPKVYIGFQQFEFWQYLTMSVFFFFQSFQSRRLAKVCDRSWYMLVSAKNRNFCTSGSMVSKFIPLFLFENVFNLILNKSFFFQCNENDYKSTLARWAIGGGSHPPPKMATAENPTQSEAAYYHVAEHGSLWFLACKHVSDRANLWYRNVRWPRVRIALRSTRIFRIFRRDAGDLIKRGGWLAVGRPVTQHSSGCLWRIGYACSKQWVQNLPPCKSHSVEYAPESCFNLSQ